MITESKSLLRVESRNGLYVAHLLAGRIEGWGVGSIGEPAGSPEAQVELIQHVVDSIVPVRATELAFSDCTDGRLRLLLDDGAPVPVREKVVGADTMLAFHIAEALGSSFYEDPNAPLAERLEAVVDFLMGEGYMPSTHYKCGAAGGYRAIAENAARFIEVPAYVERQKLLLPGDVYDGSLHARLADGYRQRLANGLYDGWSDEPVTRVITKKVGGHGLINLKDDGRGVHGHVEGAIGRLKTPRGFAVDVNALAKAMDGEQLFTVNDTRMFEIAALFGRGRDSDYRRALMAAEDFTDAGHGTLASGLATLVIEQAA